MDLHKLTIEEVKGFETTRLFEVEKEIRHEIAMMNMDIYSAQGQHTAKRRGLKRGLARVQTVKSSLPAKSSSKVK